MASTNHDRSTTYRATHFAATGLLAALLNTACATSPADAKSKAPTLDLQSERSAKAVSGCIAEKWENLYRVGTLSVRPTEKGFSVIQQDQGIAGKDFPFIADVEERGSKSATRYWNNAISAPKIDQSVIDCQR
jgi:hypothetical protein